MPGRYAWTVHPRGYTSPRAIPSAAGRSWPAGVRGGPGLGSQDTARAWHGRGHGMGVAQAIGICRLAWGGRGAGM
eukprot:gene13796-biopygen522